MLKKIIGLFCLSLAISVCVPAIAVAQTVEVDGIKYDIFVGKDYASVSKNNNNAAEEIVLCDSVEYKSRKYVVSAIGDGAFQNNYLLQHIQLPKNLKTIGNSAFSRCFNLVSLEFPQTLASIGSEAFEYCNSLSFIRTFSAGIEIASTTFYGVNNSCVLYVPKVYIGNYGSFWLGSFSKIIPFTFGYTSYTFEPANAEILDSYQQLQDIIVNFQGIESIAPSQETSVLKACLWMGDELLAESELKTEVSGTDPSAGEGDNSSETRQAVAASEETSGEISGEGSGTEEVENGNDTDNGTGSTEEGSTVPGDTGDSTTASIGFGDNSLSIHFAGIPEEPFVSKEAGVIRQVRLTIEGNVTMDECSFDLALGTAENDSSVWDVRTVYIPDAYPLDHACLQVSPSTDVVLESYKALQEINLTFDGFTNFALDAEKGTFLHATLCRNGEALYELQPEDCTYEGNVLTMRFPIKEEDVVVAADAETESHRFSLLVDGQVFLDDVKYVLSIVGKTETAEGGTAYASSLSWTLPVLRMPEPTSVGVSPARVTSCHDLERLVITLADVLDTQFDESEGAVRTAKLFLGDVSVADGTLSIEEEGLVCTFPTIDEKFFTLISVVSDTLYTVDLQIEADLMVRSPELENLYPYHFRMAPDETPTVWDVPVEVLPLPTVSVSTPLAENPQTYNDLKEILLTLDGFSSLELGNYAEGYVKRTDNDETVYRFDAGCVSVEGMQLRLDLSQLPSTSVVVIPDYEGNTVPLALYITADLLLDGLPYRLVISGNEQGAEWAVESIVIRDMPAPVLSYSYGVLSMNCGIEGATYHYTITCNDHQKSGNVALEKTGTTGFGQTRIGQFYTINVYATCEGYNDSETVTYYLDFSNDYPEVIQGETTEGELYFAPSIRE